MYKALSLTEAYATIINKSKATNNIGTFFMEYKNESLIRLMEEILNLDNIG